jgi:signal transduction histidine kinase/CheY-like chemotaxis protein
LPLFNGIKTIKGMGGIIQLLDKLKHTGINAGGSAMQTKNNIFTNSLLGIAVISYIIFAVLMYFAQAFNPSTYFISTALLLLGFAMVYFLMYLKKIKASKNILLVVINGGIFFYDFSLGKWAGVYLYYFAFFFAAVNIFSWKKEKAWLLLHLLLPILLIIITKIYGADKSNAPSNILTTVVYAINFCMSFFIIGVNAFFILSENEKFQESLELSKLNVQSLIDNTRGYIWSINNNYELVAYSSAYKDIIKRNYDVELRQGLRADIFFDYPNTPKDLPLIYERVLNGESFTQEYFSNSNFFEVQASPLYDIDGRQTGATFYSRVITQKKSAEKELQQAKINLQTLIDTIGNSTWSLTTDYKIIAASKVYVDDMKRIFGVKVGPGFDISQLFNLPNYPEQFKEQYKNVFNGQSVSVDYFFQEEHFELNAVPIRNMQEEVAGAVFFARNITYRKKTEQELTSAKIKAEEATVAKAQFLSNMSHELRTPLNGIIGLTNILLSEEILPGQAKHLEVLKYSSDHMLLLINDILDFNKIEAGKVTLDCEAFNLLETIEKLHSFFSSEAAAKKLLFKAKADEQLNRLVKGDITRLRQVLTNLIGNAIKFTEKGGVTFAVQVLEYLSDKQCTLRFSISDTGIGIASDKLDRIFERFGQEDQHTTRKYGGTGLGLTISKKLIELMGSKLEVESTAGKGSRFWFDITLECAAEKPAEAEQKKITDLKPFDSLHILVAEDNPINMIVANKILEKWNVQVSKAVNGQQALELATKNKYDLILMDLQMPVMDGLAAVKSIRQFNKDIPIIALTATSYEIMLTDLHSKGLNDFVQKPFKPEELHSKISKALSITAGNNPPFHL